MKRVLDKTKLKAIIFDMDGVLFLSSDCHEKAFLEVLTKEGIKDFSYSLDGAGARTDEVFLKVFARNSRPLSEDKLKELIAIKQANVRKLLAKKGKAAEGSHELIPKLQKKFRLAIASSASRGTVDIFLSKVNYGTAFEFILDGSSVTNAKPHPEIYSLTLERLGLDPDQCVVIEDAENGVQAAVAAGIPVVALTEESPEKFINAGACFVINDLQELESVLSQT